MTDGSSIAHRSRGAPRLKSKGYEQLEQSVARWPARAADVMREEPVEEFVSVDSWKQPGRVTPECDQLRSVVEWNVGAPGPVHCCETGEIAVETAIDLEPCEKTIDEIFVQRRRGAAFPSILILRLSSSSLDCI